MVSRFRSRGSDTTTPIAPHATKLLTTNANAALFEGACPSWCDELVYADGTTRTFPAPNFVGSASLSPDGQRVAFGNAVYDTTSGDAVAGFTLPITKAPLPYAWTNDGTLLISLEGAVGVLHPADRDVHRIIGLNGVTQIAALP